MKKFATIPLLISILILTISTFAEAGIITKIDSVYSCQGNIVSVPVRVWNFDSVNAISLVINYSDNILTYVGYEGVNPNLGNININSFPNQIRITNNVLSPYSIPSGDILININFSFTGGCQTLGFDTLTPGNCEYTSITGNIMQANFVSGAICPIVNTVAAGTISANQTICNGDDPSMLTNSASATGAGAISYNWQSALSVTGPWVNIIGATGSTYDPPALTVSTLFRRIATSTFCGSQVVAYSNVIQIYVNNVSGGVISGNLTLCAGTQPGGPFVITSGCTGTAPLTYQWQSSPSATGPWSDIPGATSPSYFPQTTTYTIWYRMITCSTLNVVSCCAPSNIVFLSTVPDPVVTIQVSNDTIVSGTSCTITVQSSTPGSVFAWSNGNTTSTMTVNPTITTTYTITVVDPNGCSSVSSVTIHVLSVIQGHLTYDNQSSTPFSNCQVQLIQGVDTLFQTTDSQGFFQFPDIENGNYVLKAKCTKPWGGANATDAMKILQHFVGNPVLPPFRVKAADVDGSLNVNSLDALTVMKRFVGMVSNFNNGDWLFESAGISVTSQGVFTKDLKGICYGDVDGSFAPAP